MASAPLTGCCGHKTAAASSNEPYNISNNKILYIEIVKNVTRVAILALSFYQLPILTAIAFTAGFIGGVIAQARSENKLEKGDLMQLCVLGYLQFASNTQIDELVGTALTAASFIDCIYRGSTFFRSMAIGAIAFGIGKEIVWEARQYFKQDVSTNLHA